ncbi:MAG: DNA alkylation repair protein [Caldilineaceae bacterium]|nr:DNA alkylation repair protein [Caldilineaceae bacterium]
MTLDEALQTLEELGTPTNQKSNRRNGVLSPQYGVSLGNLRQLKKTIKIDHELALALWNTGNHDARMLATLIANPKLVDEKLLDRWARDLDNFVLTDAFVDFVAQTRYVQPKTRAWTPSLKEWIGRAGWGLLEYLAKKNPKLDDNFFTPYLGDIADAIHTVPNRQREAMNNALIAIGLRNDYLAQHALITAQRMGTVEIDYGEAKGKTLDAIATIQAARGARQRAS